MRTVLAYGSFLYGSVSVDEGSKMNGIVLSRPVVVVAAWLMERDERRGMRNVDAQPAPRIRTSTEFGRSI